MRLSRSIVNVWSFFLLHTMLLASAVVWLRHRGLLEIAAWATADSTPVKHLIRREDSGNELEES